MEQDRKERGTLKELEKVFVLETRPGEELHGTIVSIDGDARGDIRYHRMNRKQTEMIRRRNGISVLAKKYSKFLEGAKAVGVALEKYKTQEKAA